MAVEGTPIHRNPLQELGRFIHEAGVAIARHPLRTALAGGTSIIFAAGGAYAIIQQLTSYNPDNIDTSSRPGVSAPGNLPPQSPDNPSVSTPSSDPGPDGSDKLKQPTPEAKIIGNDSIMPAELSVTGVIREFEYQGQVYKLALYKLPKDTPITSPTNNYFVFHKDAGAPFIGSSVEIFNPVDLTIPNVVLSGSLQVVNRFSRNVKAGEIIAYIQDTGEKMFGEYNFVVEITAQDANGKFFSPEAPYKEYLPEGLPRGSRIVQTQPVQPSSPGNVYLPKEK